jgi:phosphoribosylglycinamide formyltransferase-1
MRKRVAVLISGRGSNMASLVEAAADAAFPAEIVAVVSNRPGAGGLARAAAAGIATATVDHKAHATRQAFDEALDAALQPFRPDLVCLAGFMRLLTPWFVGRWQGRLLNVHPALLPAFKGAHAHRDALAAGVKVHGATVHYVVADMDAGPIIAQGAVPVMDDDTEETLGARVLQVEHILYPRALALVASGQVRLEGGRVTGGAPGAGMVFAPGA